MNFDKLNKWLSLFANVGVLIGIIVVAYELRQTQTEMRAESGSLRAQLLIQTNDNARIFGIIESTNKLENGQELSEDEKAKARNFYQNLLRYYENLHHQSQLGVLDGEIWAGNLVSICNMFSGELFNYVLPDWIGRNNPSYRSSFRGLVRTQCYG